MSDLKIWLGIPFVLIVATTMIFLRGVLNWFDEQVQLEREKTQTEAILKCQELSALRFNENWNYTSCLEAIGAYTKPKELQVD